MASPRSNLLYNITLGAAALLLGVLAAGYGVQIVESDVQPLRSVAAVGLAAAALAAVVCLLCPARAWKRAGFIVVCNFLILEGLLQVLGWSGLLPGVNIRGQEPYSRLYWTMEGRSNTVMNRNGWHGRDFAMRGDTRKIALIGDSMVEALQMDDDSTMAAALEGMLNRSGTASEVYPIALSGAGPAQYLELLQYAKRHLKIDEAIIFLHLGNDFADSLRSTTILDYAPDQYIYYTLEADGRLTLDQAALQAQRRFNIPLELNHGDLSSNISRIARTHLMTARVVKSAWERWRAAPLPPEGPPTDVRAGLARLGLRDFIFRTQRPPEALQATAVVTGLLERCRQYAGDSGIVLRLVTIPKWPAQLYDANAARPWSAAMDGYDFLLPDADSQAWAQKAGVPFLSLGRELCLGRSAQEVRALYLMNGVGHFSPLGHQKTAEAVFKFRASDQ